MAEPVIPRAFVKRRWHSLMGLWLVIFLIEHLLTNSEAALFFGEDGGGFIRVVNLIHSLPYLPVIELALLGVPFVIHGVWGVQYLFSAQPNSHRSDGSTPALGMYPRNRGYTWQRITSWVLLVAVIAHVVQMRFMVTPDEVRREGVHDYMVLLTMDRGLYTVANRLGVALYDQERIAEAEAALPLRVPEEDDAMDLTPSLSFKRLVTVGESEAFDSGENARLVAEAQQREAIEWVGVLNKYDLDDNQVMAVCPDFGTAVLLTIRDTFKVPIYVLLYTLFVLAACFHAFNGLWTFFITWGIAVSDRSQLLMRRLAVLGMIALAFLGLIAVWGTYWINLRT